MTCVRFCTPVWKAFGGLLRSTVRCKACRHASWRYDMWHCLSLALPDQRSTVEHLLLNHWGLEPLTDDNDHGDQRLCGVFGRREQDTQLVRWPRVLALHLKRWNILSQEPSRAVKVSTMVDFETLLLVGSNMPPYHLRALLVHQGHAGGGHYTSYVRSTNNAWYYCNDEPSPRKAISSEVWKAEASMCFYEQ